MAGLILLERLYMDAYDERFVSSSAVTFGVEILVGGFPQIFKERRL
jgi:hypothetical protein